VESQFIRVLSFFDVSHIITVKHFTPNKLLLEKILIKYKPINDLFLAKMVNYIWSYWNKIMPFTWGQFHWYFVFWWPHYVIDSTHITVHDTTMWLTRPPHRSWHHVVIDTPKPQFMTPLRDRPRPHPSMTQLCDWHAHLTVHDTMSW